MLGTIKTTEAESRYSRPHNVTPVFLGEPRRCPPALQRAPLSHTHHRSGGLQVCKLICNITADCGEKKKKKKEIFLL